MCYNCGCGMPNNDMGKPENITNKTFEEAAKSMGHPRRTERRMPVSCSRKSLRRRKRVRKRNGNRDTPETEPTR
jgi:hypothetical protein